MSIVFDFTDTDIKEDVKEDVKEVECEVVIPCDENTKFKVGDRVRGIEPHDGNGAVVDKLGTVIWVQENSQDISVQFDENINGHDGCDGVGKDGYCWNYPAPCFDRLELVRGDF